MSDPLTYNVPPGSPIDEQGGRFRGLFDLAAGHYPGFLFGASIGRLLPVFHFHQVTRDSLEPACRYLAENGYRTVTSDEMARLVLDDVHPGPRSVMLAFDDAWSSLWTVVGPLLHRYDLRAVTYAIPARVRDAAATRPTLDAGPLDAAAIDATDATDATEATDASDTPFCTWPELRALSASGRVDVQSHTWSHSMIFTGQHATGVINDALRGEPAIIHPRLNAGRDPVYLDHARIGFPMFARRSRMSDGRRYWPDLEACARVEARVQAEGGVAFLQQREARRALKPLLESIRGRWETNAERDREIDDELAFARDTIARNVGAPVRHMCLPWGITGEQTLRALRRAGIVTAFANRLAGQMAVGAGDHPYYLKRLDNRFIFGLPGHGRRPFRALA